MKDCVFCKIVNKEIPAEIIYEDNQLISFLDLNPVNYGHLLIIPKKHYKDILDVPEDLISKIFLKSKRLMEVIKNSLTADYVCLSVVGIEVPHFHVHLIPRYLDDGLENFWPSKKYGEGEIKKFAEKIKSAMGQI